MFLKVYSKSFVVESMIQRTFLVFWKFILKSLFWKTSLFKKVCAENLSFLEILKKLF